MCGICGFLTTGDLPDDSPHNIKQMLNALRHRGPDGKGYYLHGSVALGHSRLSIIDLSGGKQPLFNEDKSIVLICNGEIYNYPELRHRLIAQGHRFATGSDSEVIVHLWEEKGLDCLDDLRGMFAFVLYDHKQNVLFGARDRFGQKPFFYYQDNKTFSFASEIKAILQLPFVHTSLNRQGLDQFLNYQYVPHPTTLFENVLQLPAGHFFKIKEGKLEIKKYYQPDPAGKISAGDDKDTLDRLHHMLIDSVKCHMVSDVPVGLFLSGGIDSSLIGALAGAVNGEPLKSFCITFPGEKNDESAFAAMAAKALRTDHQEFPFAAGHLEKTIEELICNFDQPLADPAALPLSFLSKKASSQVKVVLTGDGGDEIFAGYKKYLAADKDRNRTKWLTRFWPPLFDVGLMAACRPDPLQLRRLRSRIALNYFPASRCSYYKNFWEGRRRYQLYNEEMRESCRGYFIANDATFDYSALPDSTIGKMLAIDQHSYLPDDLLLKTDYATMLHGLEARAPFLDHHLAAVAADLPKHLLIYQGQGKVALRRLVERYVPQILVERPKRGFSVPLDRWFREELRGWVIKNLLQDSLTVPRYFRPEVVRTIIDEHISRKDNHAGKIYILLVFEFWHRHYLN